VITLGSVTNLAKWKERKGFGVYEFPWGVAVKDETIDKWTYVIIYSKEKGKENAEFYLFCDVIMHENGIEFI
jgi:hypothetical protein